MREASSWIEYLYSKFILRDVIGRTIPGFVVLSAFDLMPKFFRSDLISVVLIYGLSFATGVFLVTVGMLLGVTTIHVWPRTRSLFVAQGGKQRKTSLKKLHKFLQATAKSPQAQQQRERLVILKTMSAAYAMAFWLILVQRLVHQFSAQELEWAPSILLLLVSLLFTRQNRHFAEEQRIWEKLHIRK